MREQFLNFINNYIEKGIVKIIYSNENIAIMNFSNSFYTVSDYRKDDNNQFYSFVIPKGLIENLVNDYQELYKVLERWGEKYIKESFYPFNDNLYNALKRVKEKTDINGPSKLIDYELEEEIKNKYMGRTK